jgi:hypothetical protein
MGRITRYSILIIFIIAIVCSSGCIVPTKNTTAPAGSPPGGTNYFVPGSGSSPGQQSQTTAQNQGATGLNPTPTPVPDDTRFLTRVPTFAVSSGSTPVPVHVPVAVQPTPVIPVYQNIFSSELSLQGYSVAYAYNLVNPPLVINFDIKPRIDSRTIWYQSPYGTYDANGNRADVYETIAMISPDAWFEIIVRDKATGTIVLDEGFGKTFGGNTNQTVSVRSSGDYQIDMSGDQVNVTVHMSTINGTA